MIRNIIRFVIILGLCCAVMGGGVAVLYAVFKGNLERRENQARQAAVISVCPAGTTVDMQKPLAGQPFAADAVYEARAADGTVAAWIAGGEDMGFASLIRVVVGVTRRGDDYVIHKVAVLSQAETPGLGATIAETRSTYTLWDKLFGSQRPEETFTPFISDFSGKTPQQIQDIHAITAATITSDAVKAAVGQAIDRIRQTVKRAE